MTPDQEASAVAEGLTEAQRNSVMSLVPGENRMGGYGKDSGCPGLITDRGIHHPVFGAHYCLTPLGLRVRAILLKDKSDA